MPCSCGTSPRLILLMITTVMRFTSHSWGVTRQAASLAFKEVDAHGQCCVPVGRRVDNGLDCSDGCREVPDTTFCLR